MRLYSDIRVVFTKDADENNEGKLSLLVHCNSLFKPYVIWFLFPNKDFYNRKVEFGVCPHCKKDIACLVEYRKSDDMKFVKYSKKMEADKFKELYKSEIEYKSTDLIINKGTPYGWVYGENKQIIDKKTGEIAYKQIACDFYGNKEEIKRFSQAE